MKTFSQYDARDMLRLSKDEMVQMIGMVDGVSVEDNQITIVSMFIYNQIITGAAV